MKMLISFVLSLSLLILPSIVLADGLVPCGGPGEDVCQACHFVSLFDLILDWLVQILSIIFALIIVYSGFRMVTSSGDAAAKTDAKKKIANAAIGFVIVLAAWLLIDLAMKSLLATGSNSLGPWNQIICT